MEALHALFSRVCGAAKFVIGKHDVVDIKEDFYCELRTTLGKDESMSIAKKCDLWRNKFSQEVNCNFVYWKQHSGERYVFRKQYVCHLSSRYKSANSKRDFDCGAKLDIKVLKLESRFTKRKDSISRDLDTEIKITFKHKNHHVHIAEQMRLQRVSVETKKIFECYFSDGMGTAGSKSYHETQILFNFGDASKDQEEVLAADASRNPSSNQIDYLFKNWRAQNYGAKTLDGIAKTLRAKQAGYAELGITLYVQEKPLVIVVLTPLMKRAHKKEFAGKIVFADTSGNCEQSGGSVTFMFAASKAGGVPLAFIAHQDQTEETYTAAFRAVREVVGPSGFGGKQQPSTFMTDDDSGMRNGLKAAFPSAVLLLCIFHVCQAVWRWLCDNKNGVGKDKRQEVMGLFRNVLYAPTLELCLEAAIAVYVCDTYNRNESFETYFDNLLERAPEWCLFERRDAVTNGHNTNNICEASVRIFKDFILDRFKAFNPVALVAFVVNDLDPYHHKRLLSFVNYQNTKPEMQYRKLLKKCLDLNVRSTSENIYMVSSGSVEGHEYRVDVENEICDCFEGIGGKFCKHLCAVHVKAEIHLRNLPKLSDDDRAELLYIATGSARNFDFYRTMRKADDCQQSGITEGTSVPSTTSLQFEGGQPADLITPVLRCSKEEIHQEFLELHAALRKWEDISVAGKEDPEKQLLLDLRRLKNKYNKVSTKGHIHNVCREKSGKSGRMIPVQPTSISRRVRRLGWATGRKKVHSGRPSKHEVMLRRGKKRPKPHSLAVNIRKNVANAKSHGTSMK